MEDMIANIRNNIKEKLKITGTEDDALLDRMVKGVIYFLEGLMDRKIKKGTFVEYFSGGRVWLKNTPVESISSVKKRDDEGNYNDVGVTVLFDEKTGEVDIVADDRFKDLEVTYTGGWDENTLPDDIRELIERLVIRQFKKIDEEGKKSEVFDGASVSWHELLLDEDRRIIERYRQTFI